MNIYNVYARNTLLCYIVNKLFGQQWLLKKLCEESDANDIETDHYIEELSPVMKRNQKEIGHLDFVLPTRNSIRKVVAEFSFTCCNDMAESLFDVNTKGQTVSYIP